MIHSLNFIAFLQHLSKIYAKPKRIFEFTHDFFPKNETFPKAFWKIYLYYFGEVFRNTLYNYSAQCNEAVELARFLQVTITMYNCT